VAEVLNYARPVESRSVSVTRAAAWFAAGCLPPIPLGAAVVLWLWAEEDPSRWAKFVGAFTLVTGYCLAAAACGSFVYGACVASIGRPAHGAVRCGVAYGLAVLLVFGFAESADAAGSWVWIVGLLVATLACPALAAAIVTRR
jgi:hypothetical protein